MVDERFVAESAGLQAARTAYENARMDGVCHEGAWELALQLLRSLNLMQLVVDLQEEIDHA